jgi:hypothetical protein
MTRTLLEEGSRDCPVCGETKDRLSRHWSYCEFPDVTDGLRALLTGILLGGGSLQGHGENTQHLLVQTTSRDLAEWLFGELGWLAHSLRRETFDGEHDPIYHVRTHAHSYLRRLRDDWYRDGTKRLRTAVALSPRAGRAWWALAGGLEWTGDYDSQVRGTFSAKADSRAAAIITLLERRGYEPRRLNRRVVLYGDDLRGWLDWIGGPVPGVEYKWALGRDAYELFRGRNSDIGRPNGYDRADIRQAIQAVASVVGEPLASNKYREMATEIDHIPSLDAVCYNPGAPYESWGEACRDATVVPCGGNRANGPYEWSPDAIRESLQRAAADLGDEFNTETFKSWANGRVAPSIGVIYDQYDTWSAACSDAGLGDDHGEWSEQAVRSALQRAGAAVDGRLTAAAYRDWRDGRDVPSEFVVYKWYSSWDEALTDAGLNG